MIKNENERFEIMQKEKIRNKIPTGRLVVGALISGLVVTLLIMTGLLDTSSPVDSTIALDLIIIALGFIIVKSREYDKPLNPQPIDDSQSKDAFVLYAMAIVATFYATQSVFYNMTLTSVTDSQADYANALSDANPISLLICVLIVAPIMEELLFRGVLLGFLERRLGTVLSAIILSLGFAFMHGSLEEFVGTFLIGLVLTAITITIGLRYSILAHMALNFGSTFIYGLLIYPSMQISIVLYLILTIIAVAVIFVRHVPRGFNHLANATNIKN